MSNQFSFKYVSEYNEDSDYGDSTSINVTHEFSDETTWPAILWQFCKFLEHTGYIGICEKVVLKSNTDYDFGGQFFETIYEEPQWKKDLADVEEKLEDMDWEAAFPKDNQDKDAN